MLLEVGIGCDEGLTFGGGENLCLWSSRSPAATTIADAGFCGWELPDTQDVVVVAVRSHDQIWDQTIGVDGVFEECADVPYLGLRPA